MHGTDGWVSIVEAARRLRVSPATVRRRIKLGQLEAELHQGRRGPEYRVRLPPEQPDATHETVHDRVVEGSDVTQPAPDPMQTVAHLLSLVERQQAELIARAESNAAWAARAELLEQQVAELRAELERARRPWWRRVLG
jgi:hypothetical protein